MDYRHPPHPFSSPPPPLPPSPLEWLVKPAPVNQIQCATGRSQVKAVSVFRVVVIRIAACVVGFMATVWWWSTRTNNRLFLLLAWKEALILFVFNMKSGIKYFSPPPPGLPPLPLCLFSSSAKTPINVDDIYFCIIARYTFTRPLSGPRRWDQRDSWTFITQRGEKKIK